MFSIMGANYNLLNLGVSCVRSIAQEKDFRKRKEKLIVRDVRNYP